MESRGAVLAVLGTMAIYGANFSASRYGTLNGLTAADLTVLRFGTAGPLMLPFFVRRGFLSCAGLGWRRGILLAITGGAFMTLIMNTGVALAPAGHGAALAPGTVTAVGIVVGALAARVWPPRSTLVGLAGIGAGLATIALTSSIAGSRNVPLGDLSFLAAGLIWGTYPILLHRWRVEPMTSAAVVAVLSMAYIPVYALLERSHLGDVSIGMLLFQAFFQGVLTIIVALWLWGYGVKIIGTRTQIFPTLVPVLGTMFAIPLLGEIPGFFQVLGLCLIVGGIVTVVVGERIRQREASV